MNSRDNKIGARLLENWGYGIMQRLIATSAIAVALAGCNSLAANKVLGDKAIAVDPAKAQRISAPGVYRVMNDGTFVSYCKEDFIQNSALKAIVSASETSTDTITDQSGAENLTLGVPGLPTLAFPYNKTKIEGYTVTRATAPADGAFFDYVRSNVAPKCRALIDSGQYLVVEQEGRAKKSYRLLKGPVSGNLVFGPATIGGVGQEIAMQGPSNATFGLVGATAAK